MFNMKSSVCRRSQEGEALELYNSELDWVKDEEKVEDPEIFPLVPHLSADGSKSADQVGRFFRIMIPPLPLKLTIDPAPKPCDR